MERAGKGVQKRFWKGVSGVLAAVLFAGAIFAIPSGDVPELVSAKEQDGIAEGRGAEISVSGNEPEEKIAEEVTETTEGAGKLEYNQQLSEAKKIESPEDVLIMLDVGHGGDDEGCSEGGLLEKEINLLIARQAESKLKEMGYQVALTRESDTTLSLEERVIIAEEAGADILVSIHQNACESNAVNGVETWYSTLKDGENSKRLARLLQMYLTDKTGGKDRGVVEEEGLYVIRECSVPSCLVECGFMTNEAERELLQTEGYRDIIAESLAMGIHYYFFPKTMYLTFDDGPKAENTERVLEILKEQDIKATFFLIGENVEKNPELARRIAEEGHTIGIHCYSHDYDKIYASVDAYIEDFEKAHQIVSEATGVDSRLFRFPGGSINAYNKGVNQEIIEEMTKRGYIYFDWNASLEDAVKHPDCETLLKNAKSSTLGRKRIIMLAHDTVYETTICLEELIEQFPEYEFLPLNEGVEAIQF